ncbi:MAG: glycosyltransferase [Pseudomonadota bacterium]|nr:glycosyltransferase [Pseudomonadota bacterium]
MNTLKIAIFISDFYAGGVSRMMVNLSNGIASKGHTMDLLICFRDAPFFENINSSVNVIQLDKSACMATQVSEYLANSEPRVLMTAMVRDHLTAQTAKSQLGHCNTKLYARSGTNYFEEIRTTTFLKRAKQRKLICKAYQNTDEVIAVSKGVADGLNKLCNIPLNKIHTPKNPTVTPYIQEQASQTISHPWFEEKEPVIVSVGGLNKRKNFELLIDAFAAVNQTHPCKLMILGNGKRLARLQARAEKLNIIDRIAFLGFIENPYPYMKQAAMTILSSNREGSPNVLAESLSLHTPLVSTDCPSGPREILDGGKYGVLVPMKDVKAMTAGIIKVLGTQWPATLFDEAVEPYLLKNSVRDYLTAFGFVN